MTNAYDHGRSPRDIRMLRLREPCSVRIEVDDAAPELPILGHSTIGDSRGRGLLIVDRLSKDRGVTRQAAKTVWADIARGAS